MFEKEAEERARKLEESQTLGVYDNDEDLARDIAWNEGKVAGYEEGFKDGAEFGYNKANEWYKVADGTIPKENKCYLVQIKDNGLAIAYFNGQHWETRYNLGESGHCVETVIAWCEIPTFEE